QILQPLSLVHLHQGRDQIFHVSGDDLIEVEILFAAAFAAQAVIGAAILGEVVSANALGAVAAAHHGFAGAHGGGVLLGALGLRHALHAMAAGLVLQVPVRPVPLHVHDYFLEPAALADGKIGNDELPAVLLAIFAIHLE